MEELLERLRRRKIVQWALAYVAAAFAILQALDIVAQQFGWPDSARRSLTIALAIGFVATVILAWYHGEKGAQRVSGAELLILAVLLVVGGATMWRLAPSLSPPPARETGFADPRSIAVLPFVNMSDDKGNEYFSDGISEEILNVLARIPELRVAARTSSFAFKGEKKEVPEIARELKVRMVIEGSVRKQAERVRVTAQLVDASNGYHVWSETYDRELKDIFTIQDEIANAITQQLKVKLAATAGATAGVSGTADLQAYDFYLKGIALWQQRGEGNLRAAEQMFKDALAHDPRLAKAWSGLALVYNVLPSWSRESEPDLMEPSRDAAEHALALDPSQPEAFGVLANIANWELRFSAGNALFERSIALAPSYATAYQWYGESLTSQGKFDAAIATLRNAISLDPKSRVGHDALAYALYAAGRYDEAIATCDLSLRDHPDYFYCNLLRFDIALARKDVAAARAALGAAAARLGPEAQRIANAQLDALEGRGDVEAIAERAAQLDVASNDAGDVTPLNANDMMLWFIAIGRNDLAVRVHEQWARKMPDDAFGVAFNPHFAVLHCDTHFQDMLRKLKVDEAQIAAPCPSGH